MPASKAQQKAVNKYMKANYDRVNLTMPKGQKDAIQNAATVAGQSVNAYINQAINERMNRDAPESVSNASERVSTPPIPGTPESASQNAGAGA